MAAYVARRILLMIPTIIGIMFFSFIVVQFAPGGPVERIIAQLQGTDVSATSRISGGTGDFAGTPGANSGGGDAALNSKYRGAQGLPPEFIADLEKQFGFDKPRLAALPLDDLELLPLRFRRELFPRRLGAQADRREDAGLHLARPVDDADLLPDLHSAGHPQGGARRQPVRRLDLAR